ncbi:DNA-binding protein [Robinsoniella peoriensis]|uniref:DNA-binding protein n=1 Tax=Robinsoniella peoriensis TaxID=180332 RepID=UPI003750BC2A
MEYITIKKASELWNITTRRIQVLCAEGRIPGAERFGHAWAIPSNAEKPGDARIKSGKYIKQNSTCRQNNYIPQEDLYNEK